MIRIISNDPPPIDLAIDDPVAAGQTSCPIDGRNLRVSLFDAITSFLMASILLLGAMVLMLLLLWLIDSQPGLDVGRNPPVRLVSTYQPTGLDRDFLEPAAQEVEALREIAVEDSLVALTDAVGRVAATATMADSDRTWSRNGESDVGDSRPAGPPNSESGVPAFDRWQLEFTAANLTGYARQLDFYGVELGVVGGGIAGVDYAYELAAKPQKRRGDPASEKRLYFMWNRPGPLLSYDQALLTRAGVELEGRQVIKFIPGELEKRLSGIELEYARAHGGRSVEEIAKTVFRSVPTTEGYRFQVIAQRYRKPSI